MSRRVDPGPFGTGPLTALDERVIGQLGRVGKRARRIAWLVHAPARGYGRAGFEPTAAQVEEVGRVLRGLEHLGRAVGRGGWWRAS